MKTKWLIDKHILTDTRYENLKEQIEKLGYECFLSEYIPFMEDKIQPYPTDDNVVVYGTVGFARKAGVYNGLYATEANMAYATYISNLGIPYCYYINGDFIMLPYGYFKSELHKIFDMFDTDNLFIRPNTGLKLFTGFPINRYNAITEFDALEQLHGVTNESLIIIANSQRINKEYRFIIVDRKVVSGSLYNVRGEHVEESIYPVEAFDLAHMVAKAEWQPDPVYTCDIAEVAGKHKILEINSFSCAGWYACDVNKIVTAVSEYSEKQWRDLWEM